MNNILNNIICDNDPSPCESTLIHYYPASMPAFLSSRLITQFSKQGNLVFDPFCGTGSVLVESSRLGRNSIGCDIQDISLRVAEASLHIPKPDELLLLWKNVKLSARDRSRARIFNYLGHESHDLHINNLKPWFHPVTYDEISSIYFEIINVNQFWFKEILLMMLGNSLISLSKRQSRGTVHWGWIADNVIPKQDDLLYVDTFKILNEKIKRLTSFVKSVDSYDLINRKNVEVKIIKHNWLSNNPFLLKPDSVDLLLTSPPYPYSIDYTLSLRLTNYLLSIDYLELREQEIGARYKRKRKLRSESYLNELSLALRSASIFVKIGGKVVLVVPEPKGYQGILNFSDEEWVEYLKNCLTGSYSTIGYSVRECAQRRVVSKSKDIKNEMVIAYQRHD